MKENPYQSPASSIGGQQSIHSGDGVSNSIVDIMARTRPWTLFVAVLGLIGVGFMVLAAIMIFVTMSKLGSVGIAGLMSFIYLAMAAIYSLPCIRLVQYSSAITQLRISPNSQTLEIALDRQRSFWMTVGIMILIGFVLMLILMAVGASQGASMSRSIQTYP